MAKPVGPAPADAYQQWLDDQRAAKVAEQMAAGDSWNTSPVQQGYQLSIDPQFSPTAKADGLQLDKPFSPPAAEASSDMQLSAPVQGMIDTGGGGAGGASSGTMAGAGIAAAGQAVSVIAQLASAQAAKEATLANNAANRDSSERMARAALLQNQGQFDAGSRMSAYQQMLAALNQAAGQTMQQRALKRANTNNRGDGRTTAFLGS